MTSHTSDVYINSFIHWGRHTNNYIKLHIHINVHHHHHHHHQVVVTARIFLTNSFHPSLSFITPVRFFPTTDINVFAGQPKIPRLCNGSKEEHPIWLVWFSLVLWHINLSWLSNAKSCFCIYIRYMICKHILQIHTVKWWNSSISNNSIYHN